jgi:hypothetical protein
MENYRTLNGLVLVLPDKDYETYQIEGRETGIFTSFAAGTIGERVSVSGTVLSVPETFVYNGDKIIQLKKKNLPEAEESAMVDKLKKESLLYDVPMEIKVKDKVLFFYKNQMDCYRDGRSVMMDVDGETRFALLMRYDTLNAVVVADDILKPLNGFCFVERVEMWSDKFSPSGLEIVHESMMGLKKKKGFGLGRVIEIGCDCKGYLDFPTIKSDVQNLTPGDYVYYDERFTNNLQHQNHQTHKTARIIVKKKDIHGVVIDSSKLKLV